MRNKIEDGLADFISRVLVYAPFYGDILLRIPIEQNDSQAPTAATDGKRIWWNSQFMGSLSEPQRNYVLMHEVLHILLMHPSRGFNRDRQSWNQAADIQVNHFCDRIAQDLKNLSGELLMDRPPSGFFTPVQTQFDQVTAEDLYGVLMAEKASGSGENPGSGAGNWQTRRMLAETKLYGGGTLDDLLRPAEGLSDIESMAEADSVVREMIRQAVGTNMRSMAGSCFVPGAVIELTRSKPLDWRVILKDFLMDNPALSEETSYTTPERKYLHMDLIIPGHCMDDEGEIEEVWAFVDSSGSIGQNEMNRFLTELYHIVREFRCILHLAYWDTSVTDIYRNIRREKQLLRSLPKHSGGTDINCVYGWMEKNRIRPGLMIILTDGYFGTPNASYLLKSRTEKTILVISNESQNPVYEKIGRVCRLKGALK